MLTSYGLSTTVVQDVQNAFEILKSHISAFLLLDISLDGATVFMKKVVETFYNPPPYIIAIDVFPCSQAQADMLNLGADICLEKPLDLKEILAVINSVLRRADRLAHPKPLHISTSVKHGTLHIDPLQRSVSIDGHMVYLQ